MHCPNLNELFAHLNHLETIEHLLAHFSTAEIARSLPPLPVHRQALILLILPRNKASAVFQRLGVEHQAQLLQEMDIPEAIWLLSSLTPRRRQEIITRLPFWEEFTANLHSELARATTTVRGIMVRMH